MILSFDLTKNSYMVDEAFRNNFQGKYLRNLIDGLFTTKVFAFLLLNVAFVCLRFLLFSQENKSIGIQDFLLFLLLSLSVIMLRFLEMKMLYNRLKRTFGSREEFIIFLTAIAYNHYTYSVGVNINDVVKDLKKIEYGGSKTFLLLKYLPILRSGKKFFENENKIKHHQIW